MKLTPEQREIARALLTHPDDSFAGLARLAKLDPATAFISADLRGVVCADDLAGFVFHNADLRGADFSRALGKTAAMFDGAEVDAGTRGVPLPGRLVPPPDFDLARVRELLLSGQAIPNDWIPFVTELNLAHSDISDLAPLSSLIALQRLDLRRTPVSDASPLAGLTALQSLYLGDTRVSDVSPLADLTALQRLDLWGTPVSGVSPLARLIGLQCLYLGGTQVSDVSPLAGFTALQHLHLWGTSVHDVSPLAGLTALQHLDLSGTPVSDVSPLAKLKHLTIDGAP